jgi:hypothetical protein
MAASRLRGDLPNTFAVITTHEGALPVGEATSRMPATVHSIADAEPTPDVEKSAVTLHYEEMLAALNALLSEMREERRQAQASGNGEEPAAGQSSVWVEAHAALSQK